MVFKGTDSLKDIRDDIKMSNTSFWSWLTGGNRSAVFMDDVISTAHSAIGKTNIDLPRRYTGHSLGGALALTAYSKYGRDKDICQVFSPYMDIMASKNINRWPKKNKITVWAHKDDKFWRTAWSNYEAVNKSSDDPLMNKLVWHDTSGGVLEGYAMPAHMMGNMREYFEEVEGVTPAAVPGQTFDNNEDAEIFSPVDAPEPRREVSEGTRSEWILENDSDIES